MSWKNYLSLFSNKKRNTTIGRKFKVGDVVLCLDAVSPLWQGGYYEVQCVGVSDSGVPTVGFSKVYPNTAPWHESRFELAAASVTEDMLRSSSRKIDYSAATRNIVRGS